MASSTVTIRLDSSEKQLISNYAKTFGMSISEFVRDSVLDKIEDELDLKDWYKAKEAFEANPVTLSAEDIAKKYL